MTTMNNVKKDIVNELHKPTLKNFLRRRVILKVLNDLRQADLIEIIPYARFNKGYKYILVQSIFMLLLLKIKTPKL